MPKFVLLCLSYYIICQYSNALDCYITDREALHSSGVTAEPKIENCRKYFTNLGVIVGPIPIDHHFRCSLVTAEAVDAILNVQTCVLSSNTCDELKSQVYGIQRTVQMYFTNVTCTICDTDLCNKGVERSIQIKSEPLSMGGIIMICFIVVLGASFLIFAAVMIVKRRRTGNVFVRT